MAEIDWDPKGLIRESYQIEGIIESQCRSIFLDWALSIPSGLDTRDGLNAMLAIYGEAQPDHPMTSILEQGLVQICRPKRRGGWRSRDRN
ncbi:hypothetical protein [uncultured Shimia sp.]|uniref:hypothetical protein n=1 Tax=uncultured Shimia sp. TaxID=573152 RepID=UPI00261F0FC5|nr:hypothetical protein [uncultured Shimia sp.]